MERKIQAFHGILLFCAAVSLVYMLNSSSAVRRSPAVSFETDENPTASAFSSKAAVATAPRIFCMILTSPANLKKRAVFVEQAWARKCDGHRFVTAIPDEVLRAANASSRLLANSSRKQTVETSWATLRLLQPAGFLDDKYAKLTDKMYLMIMDVAKNYGDYDWYLKTDDDTMIFVDNLREFLANKNSSGPFTYGYNFKVIVDKGYHSGGAGYVLPRKALHDLGAKLTSDYSSCGNTGTEDVDVARCLRKLGYEPGSSLDEQGRERFHPLSLSNHLEGDFPDWFEKYSQNPVRQGPDCCADSSISFHYMAPHEMMFVAEMLRSTKRKLTVKEIADHMLG